MSASVMYTMAQQRTCGDETSSSSGLNFCENDRKHVSTSSRRCVSFSDDHGFPLERYHLIESRSDPAYRNSHCATYVNDGSFRSMLRNSSDVVTNAGLVLAMLCVVLGSFAM